RVGFSSLSGSRYHRPAALGGPDRAVASEVRPSRLVGSRGGVRYRARGSGVFALCAPPPASSARTGASVSLLTTPAQTRAQSAASTSASATSDTDSVSCRKNRAWPRSSAPSTASWAGPTANSGSAGGSTSGADSAQANTIQPSPPGADPAPVHTTSPAVHSS